MGRAGVEVGQGMAGKGGIGGRSEQQKRNKSATKRTAKGRQKDYKRTADRRAAGLAYEVSSCSWGIVEWLAWGVVSCMGCRL